MDMKRFDVTVVGELNLDLILNGLPEKLPPERELLASSLALTLGSSSAIFAHNLSRLGSRVGFVSRVGDDPLGQISLERLAESGTDVSKVKKVAGPTKTGLTVILAREHGRNILTYPGTMFEMCARDLDLNYLRDSRHFHLSSFFLHRALLPGMAELFATMKSAGLTTSLDVNDDPADRWNSGLREVLRHVDVFFLNERELGRVTGVQTVKEGADLLSDFGCLLVVKRGAQGACLFHGGKEVSRPGVAAAVVDPVGAGDSFDAGFVHQYVRGAPLEVCLDYANLAGSFSTTRPGGTEAFREPGYFEEFSRLHWVSGATHD
jgi:sugar/nucleoside kinase (ribokinase family)